MRGIAARHCAIPAERDAELVPRVDDRSSDADLVQRGACSLYLPWVCAAAGWHAAASGTEALREHTVPWLVEGAEAVTFR